MNTQPSVPAFITHANLKCEKYIHLWWNMCLVSFESWELFCSLYQVDWRNLMKQSVTVSAQLLRGGRYGCNNGRYDCTIVMSYIEINNAVSQWLLTFNLCVSVTWPLTCAFHIPCTHTPEIIDMHRGMCDNNDIQYFFTDDIFTSRLIHICIYKVGHHWIRWYIIACLAPSHYLNQWLLIVNWNTTKKFQCNFNQNKSIIIQECSWKCHVQNSNNFS